MQKKISKTMNINKKKIRKIKKRLIFQINFCVFHLILHKLKMVLKKKWDSQIFFFFISLIISIERNSAFTQRALVLNKEPFINAFLMESMKARQRS